jgi:long-chain acyl-CoA synthetase
LNDLFRRFLSLARRHPGRPALRERPGGAWTRLGMLRRRAAALAASLGGLGVRRGDVVMIVIGNRPAFVVATLATWEIDAVLLPVDESLPPAEIDDLRRTFRPAAIVTAPRGRPILQAGAGPRDRSAYPGGAMIRLTSGTTGRPRGALVTAAQAIADGRAIVSALRLRPDDLSLGVVPLNHTFGFDNVVVPLVLQGTPALLIRRPLPSLILRAMRTRRPIVLSSVPYLLDLLARHPEPPPRSLRWRACVSAGAPLPPRTAGAFRARFGVTVSIQYGASECGGIAFDTGDGAGSIEGRVGLPSQGVRVALDRAGLSRLPVGEGRVVVSGPAVATGYVPRSSRDLGRRRFRTSDIGRFDDRGRLHISGRISSLVNVSGRKVNPGEVERALLSLDGVEDAAAMGVRDALRGERLHAWVVARRGTTIAAIRSALAERLTDYKVPRTIRLVAAIPRTARGKIDRVRLVRER